MVVDRKGRDLGSLYHTQSVRNKCYWLFEKGEEPGLIYSY